MMETEHEELSTAWTMEKADPNTRGCCKRSHTIADDM